MYALCQPLLDMLSKSILTLQTKGVQVLSLIKGQSLILSSKCILLDTYCEIFHFKQIPISLALFKLYNKAHAFLIYTFTQLKYLL